MIKAFPETPTTEENNVTLEAHIILNKALCKHIFSTGNDELRLFLTGVCFFISKDSLVFWPRMLINL
jgi:DNA polymerase III sliding clamp (beta) subunit (PCNA family)